MAFLALCCLKKCSGFEMSCSSCSEVPTSSPSNFLHLCETHVFSHMQFLQQKVCSSDLRGVFVSLIFTGRQQLAARNILQSLLFNSSVCDANMQVLKS